MDGGEDAMNFREVPQQCAIGISTSGSPDMPALGLNNEHLRDAMIEIARYMFRFGSRLVYGGDLRKLGFSELLFEISARHQPESDNLAGHTNVINYLAWPVHIQLPIEKIKQTEKDLNGVADIVCLDLKGGKITVRQRQKMASKQPSDAEWAKGLTVMRSKMLKETRARIILGGQTEQFKGSMPGIGEEALLSLNAGQPLYIVGGFGGCARDVAESIGLVEPRFSARRHWPRREVFKQYSAVHLNNGLSFEDNSILAKTPHIFQVIGLILRGLSRVATNKANVVAGK